MSASRAATPPACQHKPGTVRYFGTVEEALEAFAIVHLQQGCRVARGEPKLRRQQLVSMLAAISRRDSYLTVLVRLVRTEVRTSGKVLYCTYVRYCTYVALPGR